MRRRVGWRVSHTWTLRREKIQEVSSFGCTSRKCTFMYGILNHKGGKLVSERQFMVFTRHQHIKVCKLDDSVVNLRRVIWTIRCPTEGGCWSSKKAIVVMDNSAAENYVEWKFIDELKCQGATLHSNRARWLSVEMASINTKDGIQKRQ